MCLSKLAEFTIEEKIGYKVFNLVRRDCQWYFRSEFRRLVDYGKIGDVYTCQSKLNLYTTNRELYPPGIHVFLDLDDAKYWIGGGQCIVKVSFDKVVAKGYESFIFRPLMKTVVVKEIKLLELAHSVEIITNV